MLKRQVVEGKVRAEAGAAYVPTLGWLRAEEAATGPQEGCQTSEARAKRLGSPHPGFPRTGPRYDTRTIVWICLTLITGLVVLLLLLICKKRWVVLGPGHPEPLPLERCVSCLSPALAEPATLGAWGGAALQTDLFFPSFLAHFSLSPSTFRPTSHFPSTCPALSFCISSSLTNF